MKTEKETQDMALVLRCEYPYYVMGVLLNEHRHPVRDSEGGDVKVFLTSEGVENMGSRGYKEDYLLDDAERYKYRNDAEQVAKDASYTHTDYRWEVIDLRPN